MAQHKNSLFEAFHVDHATLGKGFHELSQCLRGGDLDAARQVARRIDTEAGAHIAFEEEHFYKALVPLLGADEVQRMYREHDEGLEVVTAAMQSRSTKEPDKAELLKKSEAMEAHIAECGELFAAMGRIPAEEQTELHRQLQRWRELSPRWTDYAASRTPSRST